MSPKDTAYIVEHLAIRFMAMVVDYERQLSEHRAAFGARTEADAKIIEGLRKERDGLLTQVQDMREEIIRVNDAHGRTIVERDALRAEVAALQERLRASIARGDFAQMEVAALKSQTPKHPVKVGEWLKRTKFEYSEGTRINTIAQVVGFDPDGDYLVSVAGSEHCWCPSNCTPCDPPTEATHDTPDGRSVAESVIRDDRNTEPKPGDTVRLIQIPIRDAVSPELQTTLAWPWIERWGTLNQTALVVEPAYQLDGALSVCLSTNVHVRWPISCIEVITEATHDTGAGKAAAEAAVKIEPVADDIKVGDLCEVFQATTRTLKTDIGITGRVSSVLLDPCHGGFLVKFDPSTQSRRSTGMQAFGLCDVRKVTT